MSEYRYTLKKFLKDWMLIICMLLGASVYLVYHAIPSIHTAGPVLYSICRHMQPPLLFAMLFLSFCKIEPSQMRPHRWHGWLLLLQGVLFVVLSLVIVWAAKADGTAAAWVREHAVVLEAAMLCLICPTATACAVVTGKLGGSMAAVVTYTVLINILVAFLVPAFVPLIHPQEGMSFALAFTKILAKVFPLLIMPCICAWLVRYLLPHVHKWLLDYAHMSFYIWSISLSLAILMSTRAIVHSGSGVGVLTGIALASLLTCIFQFWAGKRVGMRYGCKISAGQALGQKNTVFAIWMGYTFLDPVVSVAGGFYSIWHNVFNTWQLYCRRKELESKAQI